MGIPGRLCVIVGMDVDKAGRHPSTSCIDLMTGFSQVGTHGGNQSIVYGDVRFYGFGPRSIDHQPASNYQIMHFGSSGCSRPDYRR